MIYAFLNGKKEQDKFVKTFANAIGAKIVHTQHFVKLTPDRGVKRSVQVKKPLPNCTGFIFAGLLRGNAHILDLAIKHNIPYYYVDHAYFNSGYKDPYWMRVVKNGFMQNTLIPNADEKRLKQNFNINLKPYNYKNKENILVFPPSNTVARVFNATRWEENIVRSIRELTDRPIVVRKKSGPIMDEFLFQHSSKEIYNYPDTIDEVLDKAYCVVAFNTSITLTALEKGIPVICDRYCPVFPISNEIKHINDLKEYDRQPLFNSLAWGQFTLDEITNPKTFDHINKTIQWRG
jgi:hypothetical protein